MSELKIPSGFQAINLSYGTAVLKEKYRELLQAEILTFLETPGAGAPVPGGRGGLRRFMVNHPEMDAVLLRHYQRGGILAGPLLKDCYWGRGRALEELAVTDRAFNQGLPVPEALGVVLRPACPGFYRSAILTREIPDAESLPEYLAALPMQNRAALLAIKRTLTKAVVASLVRFHNAGFYHADLNMHNLVVQTGANGQLTVWIVDLDKAVHYDKLSLEQRMENLARLVRSLVKLELGHLVTPADRLRFLKDYWTAGGEASVLAAKPVNLYCTAQIRRHRRWWR